MNARQRFALANHCRLAGETAHPRFGQVLVDREGYFVTSVLTVNSGYE